MKLYKDVEILKVSGNVHEIVSDKVIKESSFKLLVNGKENDMLYCSPSNLRELAIGYLYSSNLIVTINDILTITIDDNFISTEIIRNFTEKNKKDYNVPAIKDNNVFFTPGEIFRIVKTLSRKSKLFKETGGAHNAFLCSVNDDGWCFREDVSRNNAVNKIIGNILINKSNPFNKILAVSSRVSFSILNKVAQIGIPIVASVSAPTERAIKLAADTGITLIGFVREQRMNVYTHKERIIYEGRN